MDQLGESIRKLILAGIGAAAVTKEKPKASCAIWSKRAS